MTNKEQSWIEEIAQDINRYRDGYGQLTHILAKIQKVLDNEKEKAIMDGKES